MDLTGIWYDPAHDGTGLVIIESGAARVVYLYSYAAGIPMLKDDGQLWMLGSVSDADRDQISLYRPQGEWMGQSYRLGDPVATLELTPDGDDLIAHYRLLNLGPCKPVMVSPVWGGCGGELRLRRLM